MAKVKGPLLSLSAHGTLGDVLTYSKRSLIKQCRFQKPQKDKESDTRALQRLKFAAASELWNNMSQEEKDEWYELVEQYYG